mmetsp:Transcript_16424/g.27135  ORF Transcript_16424/g.27135 Transcript_16424/m.27135 type:complete len:465 (-) Transcript_16424:200-1594(-)
MFCHGPEMPWSARYKKVRELTRTGTSTLVLATDTMTGKEIVVKNSDMKKAKGYEDPVNEQKVLTLIMKNGGHPNIAKLLDKRIDSDINLVSSVLEFVDGDLFDFIRARNGLSERLSIKLFRQLAQAVNFLHESGIVHLDLAPENILINRKMEIVKICDFGAARLTQSGMINMLRTAPRKNYAAPEVLSCPVLKFNAQKADVYSLGIIFLLMVLGKPLYCKERDVKRDQIIMSLLGKGPKGIDKVLQKLKLKHRLSEDGIGFVAETLRHDPNARLSTSSILSHPFIEQMSSSSSSSEPSISSLAISSSNNARKGAKQTRKRKKHEASRTDDADPHRPYLRVRIKQSMQPAGEELSELEQLLEPNQSLDMKSGLLGGPTGGGKGCKITLPFMDMDESEQQQQQQQRPPSGTISLTKEWLPSSSRQKRLSLLALPSEPSSSSSTPLPFPVRTTITRCCTGSRKRYRT